MSSPASSTLLRLASRALVATLALGLGHAAPAYAGGIGLVGTVGFHGDRVYYYQQNTLGEYEQMDPQNQFNLNYGGGLEVILGDKDNKILGIFRLYFQQDAPEQAPASAEEYTFTYRTDARNVGMISAGLQFGVLGDPDRLQGNIIATMGSGFYTIDQTEFIQGEAGIGGSYMMSRHTQLAGWLTGGIRYRKRVYPMTSAYLGVRYLFD